MHQSLYVAVFILTLTLAAATRGESLKEAAARCQTCHQGALDLSKYTADELAERIEALRSGEVPHPPLALDPSSDVAASATSSLHLRGLFGGQEPRQRCDVAGRVQRQRRMRHLAGA